MKHHVLCLVDTDDVAQEVIQSITSAGSGKEDVFLLTVDRPDSEGSDHKEVSQLPPRRDGGLLAGIGPAVVGGASHFMSTDGIMDVPGRANLGLEERDATAFLGSLGLSEVAGREYLKKLAEGGTLIAVQADNQKMATIVRKIFEEAHGEEISEV